MEQKNMRLRDFEKVLFPIACLLLIAFSFSYDAFQTGFTLSTLSALFVLLTIEALLFLFKSHSPFWTRIRWLVLGAIALLTLIG